MSKSVYQQAITDSRGRVRRIFNWLSGRPPEKPGTLAIARFASQMGLAVTSASRGGDSVHGLHPGQASFHYSRGPVEIDLSPDQARRILARYSILWPLGPLPRKVFDWAKECRGDLRSWPPIVGRGRGHVMDPRDQ